MDTGTPDTATGMDASADTPLPDSSTADSVTPDTAPITDTSAPDTTTADTGAADASIPDTTAADVSSDTGTSGDTSMPNPGDLPLVGGTIIGTMGETVVLQNNGTDTLSLSADGPFVFPTPLVTGAPYDVTVSGEPSNLSCTVMGGTGTITGGGVVRSVVVTCIGVDLDSGADAPAPADGGAAVEDASDGAPSFTIGGTLSGLGGGANSIVLLDNGGDVITVSANGGFTFPTPVPNGGLYDVTIETQPFGECCFVSARDGTVHGAIVTSVVVNCSASGVPVGGTISGLASGDSVQLDLNSRTGTFFSSNGFFDLPQTFCEFQTYVVTVGSNPAVPVPQTCSVTNGSGTIESGSNVSSIQVTCVTNPFTISGWVVLQGTAGDTITLTDNGGDTLTIAGSSPSPAPFTFATAIPNGGSFNVAGASTSGPPVTCSPQAVGTSVAGVTATSAASGTVMSQNVTGIVLVCN